MEQRQPQKRVSPERLRRLGFSEGEIGEAVGAAERGILEIEPPPDLVARVMARIKPLIPEPEPQTDPPWRVRFAERLRIADLILSGVGQAAVRAAAPALRFCSDLGTLPGRYGESLSYALVHHEPPWMAVENHKLIDPLWWREDDQFGNIRRACHRVNHVMQELNEPLSVRLVVLRDDVGDYSPDQLEAFWESVRDSTSDVWCIPKSRASQWAGEDVVVIGDRWVYRLERRAATPEEAIGLMLKSEKGEAAHAWRSKIAQTVAVAIRLKQGGRLEPDFEQKNPRQAIETLLRY